MRTRVIGGGALLVWCGVLGAQAPSAAVLGRDDVQFALHLVRSGHEDLAEGLCRTLVHAGDPVAAVLGHAARRRALADVDRAAIRSAVAGCGRDPGPRGAWTGALGLMLLAAGQALVGVPQEFALQLDWDGDGERAAELWSDAATLLDAAQALGDPRLLLPLATARLYRWFGHAIEAGLRYEALVQRTQLVTPAGLDRQVLAAHPDLLGAYLEWGVVQRRLAAVEDGDGKRFAPCLKVFEHLLAAAGDPSQSALRVLARREVLAVRIDSGETDTARKELDALARELTPALFKQYGLDALRERLR